MSILLLGFILFRFIWWYRRSFKMSRDDRILHRCSGLFNSSASGLSKQQARQVYFELLAPKQSPTSAELLEVSLFGSSLPVLVEPTANTARSRHAFSCSCPKLSIDEQRQRYLSLAAPNKDEDSQRNGGCCHELGATTIGANEDSIRMLLGGNGSSSKSRLRKKLITRFARRRRSRQSAEAKSNGSNNMIGCSQTEIEMALYLLEPLIEDARRHLAKHLQSDVLRLEREIQLEPTKTEQAEREEEPKDEQLRMSAMIRAPIKLDREKIMRQSESRQDSGVDLVAPVGDSDKWRKLRELADFRSSKQVQVIVGHSMGFFANLISECPLLRLSADNLTLDEASDQLLTRSAGHRRRPLTLHEFKLAACVECQRLRASIRFDWLAHCLLLAFDGRSPVRTANGRTDEDKRRPKALPQLIGDQYGDWLLADSDEELKYHDLLAMLMGQLLRRHFLEPALELFCARLEDFSRKISELDEFAAAATTEPLLMVPIDLEEEEQQEPEQAGEPRLSCSRAEQQLRQALEFVVDELASVCSQLPRLESQLDSTTTITTPKMRSGKIVVLHRGDDLLSRTKCRLGNAIDRLGQSAARIGCDNSRAVNIDHDLAQIEHQIGSIWLHEHYRGAIELVNLFRSAGGQDEMDKFLLRFEPSGAEQADSQFLRQLRFGSRQILAIDSLRMRLIREAPRFVQLGPLIRLDQSPLRASLIACLERERSLLVRLNSDLIVKSMERLRLQFDEIELGCDLEIAIDDYLSDKWQTKQSQQPNKSEQILLAGEDDNPEFVADADVDGAEDDEDNVFHEPPCQAARSGDESQMMSTVEEQFVEAIMITNRNGMQTKLTRTEAKQQQLLTIQAGAASLAADRRVAPLIECQLLVKTFQYMDKLLHEDLGQFVAELDEAFEGLVFLSEFSSRTDQQLDYSDLVVELSLRAQCFAHDMLAEPLKRLESAKTRLLELNQLRQSVLNQIIGEFHLLMLALSRRQLIHSNTGEDHDDEAGQQEDTDCVRLLDGFQESSELAAKLEMRCQFLDKQNALLERELSLLNESRIGHQRESQMIDVKRTGDSFDARREIIDNWRLHASMLAAFWRLVEEFETQQVKWLNSDTKRLEFSSVARSFSSYTNRLDELEMRFSSCCSLSTSNNKNATRIFDSNLKELRQKFGSFREQRLPIFRFLTNKHLTKTHWLRLSQLLGRDVTASNRQIYTTLAQFLELHIDKFVDALENLDKQATMEHELSMFLLVEADQLKGSATHGKLIRSLDVSAFLENWSDSELELAASRFMECKCRSEQGASASASAISTDDFNRVARRLVATHSLVKRYLRQVSHLNLDFCGDQPRETAKRCDQKSDSGAILIGSNRALRGPNSLKASFFVEFIRLFTHNWLESQQDLLERQQLIEEGIGAVEEHLRDIGALVSRVEDLEQNELKVVNEENNQLLIRIESATLKLELEREILATREVLALDRQREALTKRDQCVKQVTERAIPALRAATKALSCLDGNALRALRNLRPNPPQPVRQVIEAVCLLKSCVNGSPLVAERRFDAVRGLMVSDYWPAACRMLNGQHSSKFFADLKKVSKDRIAPEVMRLIRRRYLSSARFKLTFIGNVSRECACLARWLIAVDVFDRVINVVRPNYRQYVEAEQRLAELLADVTGQRRQIDSIEVELRHLEDLFKAKLSHKTSLGDLLAECKHKLQRVESTRSELRLRRETFAKDLDRLSRRRDRLASHCCLEAAEVIYVHPVRSADARAGESLRQILRAVGSHCDHHRGRRRSHLGRNDGRF